MKRILIIDDAKNIQLTVSRVIEGLRMEPVTAGTGELGLEKLNQDTFDLVFLDLNLPGISGLETLEEMQKSFPHLPVVIFTAYGSTDAAVEAFKKGAADFLQKPFTPEEIEQTVHDILEDRGAKYQETEACAELIRRAFEHIHNKRFTEAFALAQVVIGKEPYNPEVYNLYGTLYRIEGERALAKKFFRAALAMDPSYSAATENLFRMSSSF